MQSLGRLRRGGEKEGLSHCEGTCYFSTWGVTLAPRRRLQCGCRRYKRITNREFIVTTPKSSESQKGILTGSHNNLIHTECSKGKEEGKQYDEQIGLLFVSSKTLRNASKQTLANGSSNFRVKIWQTVSADLHKLTNFVINYWAPLAKD